MLERDSIGRRLRFRFEVDCHCRNGLISSLGAFRIDRQVLVGQNRRHYLVILVEAIQRFVGWRQLTASLTNLRLNWFAGHIQKARNALLEARSSDIAFIDGRNIFRRYASTLRRHLVVLFC